MYTCKYLPPPACISCVYTCIYMFYGMSVYTYSANCTTTCRYIHVCTCRLVGSPTSHKCILHVYLQVLTSVSMYMHVHTCISCVYIYMFYGMSVYTYSANCMYTCKYLPPSACTCMYIHVYTCTTVCLYTRTVQSVQLGTCTCIYIHVGSFAHQLVISAVYTCKYLPPSACTCV